MNIDTLLAMYTTPLAVKEMVATNDYIYQAFEDETANACKLIHSVLSESIATIQALANGAKYYVVAVRTNAPFFDEVVYQELVINDSLTDETGDMFAQDENTEIRICARPHNIRKYTDTERVHITKMMADIGARIDLMEDAGIISIVEGTILLSRHNAAEYVKQYNAAVDTWNTIVLEANAQYKMFATHGKEDAITLLTSAGKSCQYVDKF